MLKRYVGIVLFVACASAFLFSNNLQANAANNNVVISQVQTRSLSGGSASDELIEIFNNSDVDVDVTDWCVEYGASGSFVATKSLACIKPTTVDVGNSVILPARSYILLISKSMNDVSPNLVADIVFASGISDSGRWVSIVNKSHEIIDLVEWSSTNSITAEGGKAAAVNLSTNLLQRKTINNQYLDTNNNFDDFEAGLQKEMYHVGSLYEVSDLCLNIDGIQGILPDMSYRDQTGNCYEIVDVCQNLEGVQSLIPDGYGADEYDNCYVDICLNLDGLQVTLPEQMEQAENGFCVYHDECLNLDGVQNIVPIGYKLVDSECKLDLSKLLITELLPSVDGSDEGNEFIEIYNPSDFEINLADYKLRVVSSSAKFYNFPTGIVIGAHQYLAFFNSQINFTLVNTTGSVEIWSLDDQLIDNMATYNDPAEDVSWALIDGVWQYTNRPTFGLANLPSVLLTQSSSTSELKPCGPNQYRNPETNRCKTIVSESTLVPCKTGQYRSEETNRCRNIVSDVVSYVPCAEGQERNPLTNRCRSIQAVLAATSLAPCKEGQERNPLTNRCRKIVTASDIPAAGYAVEKMLVGKSDDYVWWSLLAVGSISIVYAFWEWRIEAIRFCRKLKTLVVRSK